MTHAHATDSAPRRPRYLCNKCSWEWFGRYPGYRPVSCPNRKCNSATWDRPAGVTNPRGAAR